VLEYFFSFVIQIGKDRIMGSSQSIHEEEYKKELKSFRIRVEALQRHLFSYEGCQSQSIRNEMKNACTLVENKCIEITENMDFDIPKENRKSLREIANNVGRLRSKLNELSNERTLQPDVWKEVKAWANTSQNSLKLALDWIDNMVDGIWGRMQKVFSDIADNLFSVMTGYLPSMLQRLAIQSK
jgi:hypothetical protein